LSVTTEPKCGLIDVRKQKQKKQETEKLINEDHENGNYISNGQQE